MTVNLGINQKDSKNPMFTYGTGKILSDAQTARLATNINAVSWGYGYGLMDPGPYWQFAVKAAAGSDLNTLANE